MKDLSVIEKSRKFRKDICFLFKKYSCYITIIIIITMLLEKFFSFLNMNNRYAIIIKITLYFAVALLLIFINFTKTKKNKVNFDIKCGDILIPKDEEISIIPFNTFFETSLENSVVSKRSIHGKFLRKFKDLENLEDKIDVEPIGKTPSRKNYNANCTEEYEVGTIIEYKNYLLLAFARNDERCKATSSLNDLITCICKIYEYAESNHIETINIPIFGTSVVKLEKGSISELEVVRLFYSISMLHNFSNMITINILIYNKSELSPIILKSEIFGL